MTTKQLLGTFLLGALAWVALLGVFVFVDEPHLIGRTAPQFHAVDLVYLAVPLALIGATVYTPLRVLARLLRHDGAE